MAKKDRNLSVSLGITVTLLLTSLSGCGSSNGEDGDGAGSVGGASGYGGSGTLAGGASASTTRVEEVAEKGLCAITIQCPSNIVDDTETLCSFGLSDSAGTRVYADSAAVKIRGRTSSNFPKKNYGIELRTAANVDNPVDLLGMGKEADWVLDGAWADRSFMRNRLTYSLLRDANSAIWAPRARYCELSLNGENAGIYVLLERIKRDDDRLNLPEDDGSGSTFIVKQDEAGTLHLSIGVGDKWQLVYPKEVLATPVQRQAAQQWLDRLGAALQSSNPNDLLTMVDPAKIVDWMLVEEFAKNIDAYNLSLYFVKNAGGPVWVVPWDIDLGYGQPTLRNTTNDTPTGWVNTRTALITKLSAIAELHAALGPRYRQLRGSVWSNTAVNAKLDAYAAILATDAIARNFAKWPIESVDFSQFYAPYTFYDVTSYTDEMAHFRSWIEQRLAWLDENIDSYPTH
jgi:hypothetical protein